MRFLPTHFICLHSTLDQNMIRVLADILAHVLEVLPFPQTLLIVHMDRLKVSEQKFQGAEVGPLLSPNRIDGLRLERAAATPVRALLAVLAWHAFGTRAHLGNHRDQDCQCSGGGTTLVRCEVIGTLREPRLRRRPSKQ